MNSPIETGARRRFARTARALEKAENDLVESVRSHGATGKQLEGLRKMFADMRTSPTLGAANAAANLRQ